MDPVTIISKLKELGHAKSKRSELQEYCDHKIDQVNLTNFKYHLTASSKQLFTVLKKY